MVITPALIDFKDVVELYEQLRSHYHVLAAVIVFWIVFVILMLWARMLVAMTYLLPVKACFVSNRKDKIDSSMREILIPPDCNKMYNFLYEVVVSTGLLRDSGTTATVKIRLEGKNI